MTSSSSTPIDWKQLLAELDADSAHPADSLETRLQQRAKAYAAVEKEVSLGDVETYTLLTFRLGAERYALEVRYIRGIRPLSQLTRVPGTPIFYRGVVNIRGQIITVLDLQAFFGSEMTESNAHELILASAAGLELALLADHIEDVMTLPVTQVTPVEIPYAHGMTHERMVILDMDTLFSDDRLIAGGKNG